MNALLIGLRASGKTSIAKYVADAMHYTFIDLDDITPTFLNATTAAEALNTHGQEAFRAAEFKALTQVLAADRQIIASGGGTPTAPGAAELIAANCIANDLRVIYLRAAAKTLAERLAATDPSTRPALTNQGIINEIPTLLAKRDDLYRSLADEVIQVDRLTIEDAAKQVLTELLD